MAAPVVVLPSKNSDIGDGEVMLFNIAKAVRLRF
jgi:hypothetical protein